MYELTKKNNTKYCDKMKRIVFFISCVFLIVFIKIFYLRKNDVFYYKQLLTQKTSNYIMGNSAKRGRILDINGDVLVDNVGIKTIYFNNIDRIKKSEKIEIAYKLADILTMNEASILNQKKFYLETNNIDLLTEEEHDLYKKRKLKNKDIRDIQYSRIDLQEFSLLDKKAAQIYYLMNKDYELVKKEIKKNVNEEEYAKVIELNLPGITGEISWERSYLVDTTLKSIFGTIGPIPVEKKDFYLSKGYSLSDTVGLSYLELEYDDYLRGEKSLYKVNNGKLVLIKEEKPGKDIYLNIDITIQQELESIIKSEILKAKNRPNTEYFHDIYASIADPLSGNIKAISALRYNDNKEFSDITSDIISSSFTVGSVVKGATIAVGYNNNLIEPNKYIYDSCVKLYLVPQKCSFKNLGRINDISALANSSNYYQYMIAINLTNKKYYPNIKLNVTNKEFDIYRNTLKTYGLGTTTMIDLPNEKMGIQSSKIADDLLLNLAIGQYDTYTNIQLLQYINTIATGSRYALNIVNHISDNSETTFVRTPQELNGLEISDENLDRVRLGLSEVIKSGTGKTSADIKINPAGKTGTSESFFDSNLDGKMDVKTISTSLALYYPLDEPKYSIAIIAPNISHNNNKNSYTYSITKHISNAMTNFLFENY